MTKIKEENNDKGMEMVRMGNKNAACERENNTWRRHEVKEMLWLSC